MTALFSSVSYHTKVPTQSGKFTLERVRSHCWLGVPGVAERRPGGRYIPPPQFTVPVLRLSEVGVLEVVDVSTVLSRFLMKMLPAPDLRMEGSLCFT